LFTSGCEGIGLDGGSDVDGSTEWSGDLDPFYYGREWQTVSVTSVTPFSLFDIGTVDKLVVTAEARMNCGGVIVWVRGYLSRQSPSTEEWYPNGLPTISLGQRFWLFSWNTSPVAPCPSGDYATVNSCWFPGLPTNAEADCSQANPPDPGPNCPTDEWVRSIGGGAGVDVMYEMPEVSLDCEINQFPCEGPAE
jgi:hypothetical protein